MSNKWKRVTEAMDQVIEDYMMNTASEEEAKRWMRIIQARERVIRHKMSMDK